MQKLNKAIVLQFWCVLEQLTPLDLTQTIQQSQYTDKIHFSDTDSGLPWLNPEILYHLFKLPNSEKKKPQKYTYQVFLGIFQMQCAFDFLQSLLEPEKDYFENLTLAIDASSCIASVLIDSDGFFVADSLLFSRVPWAIKQLEEIFTSGLQPELNALTAQYQRTVADLNEHFADWLQVRAQTNRRVTVNDLKNLLKRVQCDCWQPDNFTSLACYTVKPEDFMHGDGYA